MDVNVRFNPNGKRKPELLAPAGDFASFLGAINAGADAVYLAGEKFGARAYANNFTSEEILDAILYAHLHNAKVYLTVNTKTKTKEGRELYDYLNPLYKAGLDGVIVQDFGVFSYIHEVFPKLAMHVSTQMAVSSSYGAAYLKEKGAARIVPARELTLPEVEKINDLGIETECFIHGSMCYSYSGLCLFSSFLGERSGNRGRCAGPCRQPYCLEGTGKEQYLLSLKDMCTIQTLPKLIDAGITSFKIEGRMKSPAYASGVTRIYRKYIDAYQDAPEKPYAVSDKDLGELTHLYLRTDLQTGYYEKTSSASMVSVTSPSYNKTDDALSASLIDQYCRNKVPVTVKANVKAVIGECFTLTFTNPYTNEEVCVTGSEVTPAMKAPVTKEDMVSRLRKSSLGLFSFDVSDLSLSDNAFVPVGAMNAIRREAEEKLRESLIGVYAREDGEDIPEFWDEKHHGEPINNNQANNAKLNIENQSAVRIGSESDDIQTQPFSLMIQTRSAFHALFNHLAESDILCIPVEWMEDDEIVGMIRKSNHHFRVILPYVFRNLNTERLSVWITICEEIPNVDGYYANQIDSLAFLKQSNITKPVFGDYGLYTANSKAIEFLRKEISSYTCDTELNFPEIRSLGAEGGEFIVYGRIPLMQTANCVKKTTGKCNKTEEFISIKDRTGAIFPIYAHCNMNLCYNTVYNSVPVSLHKQFDEIGRLSVSAMQLRFTDESKEECIAVYDAFKALRDGRSSNFMPSSFTKGHFKKSVL